MTIIYRSRPPPSVTDAAITSFAIHRSSYSIRVDGGFVGHGTWLVHGVVAFRPHRVFDAPDDVLRFARRQLIRAIARESRMARDLGACSIYVVVEGDGELAGFYQMLVSQPARGASRASRSRAL